MWDLIPLLYFPIHIPHTHVRASHIADLPSFPGFPLVAGNLHDNAQEQLQEKVMTHKRTLESLTKHIDTEAHAEQKILELREEAKK